jgi:hypothetical protein
MPPPPPPPSSAAAAVAGGRLLVPGFLAPAECAALRFILDCCATRGYRPQLHSATLGDVAAGAPALLGPLLGARRRVWDAVEAAFGCELELCPQFTGLLRWRAGAALGWHHDAVRLRERHFGAVVYLGTSGRDFEGGDLVFRAGPLARLAPTEGALVAYPGDAGHTHAVEAVARGQRDALTLWFSRDPAAGEDGAVLRLLAGSPRPPPSSMFTAEGGGDLRAERLRERHGILAVAVAGAAAVGSDGGGDEEGEEEGAVLARCDGCPHAAPRFASLSAALHAAEFLALGAVVPGADAPSCTGRVCCERLAAAAAAYEAACAAPLAALAGLLPAWRALGALEPPPPPPWPGDAAAAGTRL